MRDNIEISAPDNKGSVTGQNCIDSRDYSLNNEYIQKWCLYSHQQTTSFSLNTIKGIFLLNGSASVALLAFMGNLVNNSQKIGCCLIFSLLCFGIGCFGGVACNFFAYLAQGKFTHHVETGDEKFKKNGYLYNFWAINCGALSCIIFLVGCFLFAMSLMKVSLS